jgi:hypothetical protein
VREHGGRQLPDVEMIINNGENQASKQVSDVEA